MDVKRWERFVSFARQKTNKISLGAVALTYPVDVETLSTVIDADTRIRELEERELELDLEINVRAVEFKALASVNGHLQEELTRLRAIIDARLCTEHANSIGLYGYEEGDNTTPKGGGCAVCIGMKLEQENTRLWR